MTLYLPFAVLGRLKYNSSLGCGEQSDKGRQAREITDAQKTNKQTNIYIYIYPPVIREDFYSITPNLTSIFTVTLLI